MDRYPDTIIHLNADEASQLVDRIEATTPHDATAHGEDDTDRLAEQREQGLAALARIQATPPRKRTTVNA